MTHPTPPLCSLVVQIDPYRRGVVSCLGRLLPCGGEGKKASDEQTLRLLRAGREVESAKVSAFEQQQQAILEHISEETGAVKSRLAALVEHRAKLLKDKEALTRGRVSEK